jgi:bis(5'-nucleosyl)-tetraphosphatase (symmetrical)
VATYAIGDLQGCHDELLALLERLDFDPARDRLWFVGDLVNRGPKSLACLRFVRDLGDSAVTVLGNHDLHLLAIAAGNPAKHDGDVGLEAVLAAPDRDELLDWLRHRPLLHRDEGLGFTMIHAGLPPQWDITTASQCAREVEATLRSDDHIAYFLDMYGNKPRRWDPALEGMKRLRFITNCFTRLRYCAMDGTLALKEKGPPGSQAAGAVPWYSHPARASRDERIVFGHWSTHGYAALHNVWAIDTACLWGGTLTALRLDGPAPEAVHYACEGQADPLAYA